ncbi:MAG: helix-turn-helix domain-containing protein [Bacteroidota bacterium]|jgi:hypothetical protein
MSNNSSTPDIQAWLRAGIPANRNAAQTVADVLDISLDAAYRRLRGQSPLTLEEGMKLAAALGLSLDALAASGKGQIVFELEAAADDHDSRTSNLERLLQMGKALAEDPEARIVHTQEDIIPFRMYGYRQLRAFKHYHWERLYADDTASRFDPATENLQRDEAAAGIYRLYMRIPSLEVWSEYSLDSTLRQIRYDMETGHFSSAKDALEVTADLHLLLDDLQEQARTGRKHRENDFQLFWSEIAVFNGSLMLYAKGFQRVYAGHHTMHYLSTSNLDYCRQTEQWNDLLLRRSLNLTGYAEKLRYRFFSLLKQRVKALEAWLAEQQ